MPCWCSHWLFVNPCSKSQSRDGCIIHEAVFWTTPTFRLRKIRLNLNTSAYIPPQNVAWLFFWSFLAWLETVIANKEKGKLVATMGVSLNKITFFSLLLFGLNPAAANVKELCRSLMHQQGLHEFALAATVIQTQQDVDESLLF